MTAEWTPLSVDFFMDPKVASVSGEAKLLLLSSFCHCQSGVTDGRIRAGVMPILYAQTGASSTHADELCAEGLWQREGADYVIPTWLKWNDDAATVNQRKQAARDRARKSRERRTHGARTVREESANVRETCADGAEPQTQTSSQTPAPEQQKPAVSSQPTPPKGDVEAVFEAWRESTGRGSRTVLDAKRRRIITSALRAYPLEDVIDAVRGWRHSPHHRGENERHTVYNDLDLLLRDAKRIEQFRDLERDDPATHAQRKRPRSFSALEQAARAEEVRALEAGEVA